MDAFTDNVKRSLLLLFVLLVLPSHSITVNIDHDVRNIIAQTRIQLTPLNIPCFLNDIVRLSAPMINDQDLYYLSKPNGDTTKLNLRAPKQLDVNKTDHYQDKSITVRFVGNSNAIVKQAENYDVFSVAFFNEKLKHLEQNEFMIGPLLEEDFGNWVLSIYTKDLDDRWMEMFQVITLEITMLTTLEPSKPKLNVGDTFNLSFAFPFPTIKSCEVVAPRTTFDRFFTRSEINFNKCGFSIPNLTKEDGGIWRIIGVGSIIYEGEVMLEIIDPSPTMQEETVQTTRKEEKG